MVRVPMGVPWIGPPTLRVDLPLFASNVQLTAICGLGAGCQRDSVRAAATLRNVTLDVRDDVAPVVERRRQPLGGRRPGCAATPRWGSTRPTTPACARCDRGRRPGRRLERACRATSYAMKPCPATLARLIDRHDPAARRPERPSCARRDAGGRRRAALDRHVDNVAPTVGDAGDPRRVRLAGPDASSWGSSRATGRAGRACGASHGRSAGWTAAAACRALRPARRPRSPSRLPGAGEWKARAWATDALRSGAKSAWSEPLRFDAAPRGARPSTPAAAGRAGRAPSNAVLSFPDESARGPSGIAGYAVARGDAEPGTAVTQPGERALVDLGDLPEGVTTVRARAISGAGVAVGRGRRGEVRIDRTPPRRRAEHRRRAARGAGRGVAAPGGAPAPRRADQEQLSGMTPAPDGEPVTAAGYLEYQVDDAPPVRVRTRARTVDLPDDGLHVVTVRAVDAAGNVSDPQRATFRVDRNAPGGLVERIAPPSRGACARAVTEECIAAADARAARRPAPGTGRRTPRRSSGAPSRASSPTTGCRPASTPRGSACATAPATPAHLTTAAPSSPVALRLPLRDRLIVAAGVTVGGARGAARVTVRSGHARARPRARDDARRARSSAGAAWSSRSASATGDWRLRAMRVSDDTGRVAATLPRRPEPAASGSSSPTPSRRSGRRAAPSTVAVPARVTMRASRGRCATGRPCASRAGCSAATCRGAGASSSCRGTTRCKGRWQPVRTQGLRTTGTGRWTTTYRFTATVGATVTYRFRVRVRAAAGPPVRRGLQPGGRA